MLKPNEIERISMALNKPMRALENQIMEDIVRRIKINGEITRSADWQIKRLTELGMAKSDIKKAIQENLNLSDEDMHEMYKKVVRSGYARDKEVYQKCGKRQVPFEENQGLQQLLSAVSEQTGGELQNISQSLGFAVRQPNGQLTFTEVGKYYQDTLDNAVMGIASGVFDYNTVIKKVISEMTNSGLRTVDYETGWSNRVDVAARRSVMTGLSQLTAKVNENNAKELDTDMYEVTWHSGARPSHQVWQGKWYTHKQLVTICGLGSVTGLCGANCYHDYYPVIPGISEPAYTDDELKRMNAEENTPVSYNGREYTKYEALQRQRKLETTMRAQRQQIHLLEVAGADEDDIINARCRYRGTSQEYTRFSREMDLPQQRARVNADGLGNIGVGKRKKAVDNLEESGIIINEKSKKPITKITDKAIENVPKVKIDGYTDEQCDLIQQQHKELLKYSRDNNDDKEVAFVMDSSIISRKEFLGSDDKLDFDSELYGKDLFVMHNHPRNSSYSIDDIVEFLGTSNIKSLSIVKNNGKVEVLTKLTQYDRMTTIMGLDRMVRKKVKIGSDAEYRAIVNKFLDKYVKLGVIEWLK